MKKNAALFVYAWLLMSLWALITPVFAQPKQPLTKRESDNLIHLATKRLKNLNYLLNFITEKEKNDQSDIDSLVKYSVSPNGDQIFYNDQVQIEDDIDPNHNSASKIDDYVSVKTYFNNLYLFYIKTAEADSISFSKIQLNPFIQQENNVINIKGFFTSTFKGKHSKIDKPYQPTSRVVEMRSEKIKNKWQVLIIRLGFVHPGEGAEIVANKPILIKGKELVSATNGRPSIPENLSITGPEVQFRQPENNVIVTLKFNRNWLEVMKSGASDVPVGFYQRQDKLYVYDTENTIEFQNNNTRFTFHKGLEFKGYERLMLKPVSLLKPDSVAKPPGTSALPKPVIRTDTTQTIAAKSKKKNTEDKPAVTAPPSRTIAEIASTLGTPPDSTIRSLAKIESPKVKEKKKTEKLQPIQAPVLPSPALSRPDTAQAVASKVPAQLKKKSKKEKPIVAMPDSKTLGPDLANALTTEAKQRKARYRTMGLLQVVAGIAGLAGSYVAYSSIRKDYNTYTTAVDKLNTEYNAWREIARQPSGSAMTPISVSSYGSPGVYGAYAGGGISLGLIINGVRSLGKAGKIKATPAK